MAQQQPTAFDDLSPLIDAIAETTEQLDDGNQLAAARADIAALLLYQLQGSAPAVASPDAANVRTNLSDLPLHAILLGEHVRVWARTHLPANFGRDLCHVSS